MKCSILLSAKNYGREQDLLFILAPQRPDRFEFGKSFWRAILHRKTPQSLCSMFCCFTIGVLSAAVNLSVPPVESECRFLYLGVYCGLDESVWMAAATGCRRTVVYFKQPDFLLQNCRAPNRRLFFGGQHLI